MRFEYETGINKKKNFTKQCRCRVGIEIALLYNQALVLTKSKIRAHRLGCSESASSQKQCIDRIILVSRRDGNDCFSQALR